MITQRNIIFQILLSVERLFAGVTVGATVGLVASFLVSESKLVKRLFFPTLQIVAGVPVILWMPFCAMLFGVGEAYKIALLATSTFFVVYPLMLQGISSTETYYFELAEMYEKTSWQRIVAIIFPATLRSLFTSIRASLVLGWVVLFFAEYASSQSGREGLAWYIANARNVGQIEQEFAGLLLLALIALLFDRALGFLQKRSMPWSSGIDVAADLKVAK